MEKLELHHIAPYLPYGLKVSYKSKQWSLMRLDVNHCDLMRSWQDDEGKIGIEMPRGVITHKNIKPILRPLSDVNKTVDIDGRETYYINEITHSKNMADVWYSLQNGNASFQLKDWQFLFQHHFDVFGLIESGLAIDINTLKATT